MFLDTDPLEEEMAIRCEDMRPDQLVAYVKQYQELVNNLTVKVDGTIERTIFRSLQKLYGKRDAGLIVKWAFYTYKGFYQGEPIDFFSFGRKHKWWTDKLFYEMQKESSRGRPSVDYSAHTLGVRKLIDL